jgi:hypothetical protein
MKLLFLNGTVIDGKGGLRERAGLLVDGGGRDTDSDGRHHHGARRRIA